MKTLQLLSIALCKRKKSMRHKFWTFVSIQKLFILTVAILFSYISTAQDPILDNGTIKVKLDLTRGGAISYVSLSGSTRSLVNISDEGRYIQQSYYAGNDVNRQAQGQSASWSPWPWNPIQVGDYARNRAQILDFQIGGNTMYVKCTPMLWDMNNMPAEAEIEQWTTLIGNVLTIRNKLTCHRTDNIYAENILRDQELPAVYPISALSKLYTYFGSQPFTGAALSNPATVNLSSGFWGVYKNNMVTENWMAFVDNSNWGMGVYNPLCTDFLAGMAGSAGGEATSSGTSYIAPVKQEILNKNSVYEYQYYIIIGNVTDIRSKVYEIRSTSPTTLVNSVTVSGNSSVDVGSTAVMSVSVLPSNATNQLVNYSVDNSAVATINAKTGLLTGVSPGTVTVTATAVDGSGVSGTKSITIMVNTSNTIYGWDFGTSIQGWNKTPHNMTTSWGSTLNTLQCSVTGADPYVYNTTNPAFTTANLNYLQLRVKNSTGDNSGSIYLWTSTGGLFQIPFSMTPNSAVYETINVTLSGIAGWSNSLSITNARIDPNANGNTGIVSFDYIQFMKFIPIPVTSITVNGSTTVNVGNTAQMNVSVLPANATNPAVSYSVNNTAIATINSTTGLLTGVAAGTVIVTATALDGSGITGTLNVTVQVPSVSGIVNGCFEAPATSTYQYGPFTNGWTFDTGSGVQRNGSIWGAPTAREGIQTAFLQTTGVITQSVNFNDGSYKVGFFAAQRSGNTQIFNVYYDATLIGTITPASTTWAYYTSNVFTATAGAHTVKFVGTKTTDQTAFIDAVDLVLQTTLTNTGFETPATTNYQIGPFTNGWTFDGLSGVQKNGSAWGAATAPEGTQTAFLQGDGTIYQDFTFAAGIYKVNFLAAKRSSNTQTQSINVYCDALMIGTIIPTSSSSYGSYSTNGFSVTAGTHRIKFVGVLSSDNTTFIDKVSLVLGGQKSAEVLTTESESLNDVTVYPNPASEHITISNIQSKTKIAIYSLDGRKVYATQKVNNGSLTLFVNDWKKGLYLIQIQTDNKRIVRKMIIK